MDNPKAVRDLLKFRMRESGSIMESTNLYELVLPVQRFVKSLYPIFPVEFYGLKSISGRFGQQAKEMIFRFYSDHSMDDKFLLYFKDVAVKTDEYGNVTSCQDLKSGIMYYLHADPVGIGKFQLKLNRI